MATQDENKWGGFKLIMGGKEIEGISEWKYSLNKTELNEKLKQALENEDYLLCAEIQKEIDNLNNK